MSWAVRPCASYDEVRIALGVIWHYFEHRAGATVLLTFVRSPRQSGVR